MIATILLVIVAFFICGAICTERHLGEIADIVPIFLIPVVVCGGSYAITWLGAALLG